MNGASLPRVTELGDSDHVAPHYCLKLGLEEKCAGRMSSFPLSATHANCPSSSRVHRYDQAVQSRVDLLDA